MQKGSRRIEHPLITGYRKHNNDGHTLGRSQASIGSRVYLPGIVKSETVSGSCSGIATANTIDECTINALLQRNN